MKIINSEIDKNFLAQEIKAGKIFVYPTDTIYGLGCDATNAKAVKRLREIKNRDEKPFSVIAPSREWIRRSCFFPEKELEKLPGPYTFFVDLKNKGAVTKAVNPGLSTLGVCIPNNWFSCVVTIAGVPFVTTSVNLAGEKHMEKIEDINESLRERVDYVVYDGEIRGEPSIKIDLTKQKEKNEKTI